LDTKTQPLTCICSPASGSAISGGAERLLEQQESSFSTSLSYFWFDGSRKRGFFNVSSPVSHASPLLSVLQTVAEQSGFMNIDMQDVLAFNPWLYKITIRYPVELIPIYDKVIKDLASRMDDQYEQFIQIRVREASPWLLQLRARQIAPVRSTDRFQELHCFGDSFVL
jgi:hypothetical protein